ncbi:MAG: type I-B CRISPR-associated endonuclease Cas1 [Candidatus Marinimicrobia bacterium]|nr:type I-B CRISPR-associated endonuclease Cas1 [Candidatus Neomarinimicrobiota bacterium]
MKESIYIFSNGRLKRKDNTLFFEGEDDKKRFIPVENVREMFAFGEIDLNSKILNFLSQKEIILHYFNYYGYYAGSFYPREHYNSGYMILKQASAYENEEIRLDLAKSFIRGAAENTLKIIRYYNRRGKDLGSVLQEIEDLLEKVKNAASIEESMAWEGQIKQSYYQSFSTIIDNPEFAFNRRTRRPPKDYLNAMISFGNSIIYTQVLSEIYQTHLDPRIGYLHTTNFRRFTLNLDVAEIFKPVIGDRTIFSCLNKNIISAKDFVKDTQGILLNENGKKKFLKHLQERMVQTIKHSGLKKQVSYRRLIRLELYKLEKHLMGEKQYKPFIMEW